MPAPDSIPYSVDIRRGYENPFPTLQSICTMHYNNIANGLDHSTRN